MRVSALTVILALTFTSHSFADANVKKPTKPDMSVKDVIADAPLESDYVQGSKDAPITIIEYASLSCSHCAQFHTTVYPTVKENYIDTGKALYILRPFPLNEPALRGTMLLDCVGEDEGAERYYTFAKVLFEAQSKWAFDQQFLSSLKTFAKVGGVSEEAFDACMADSAREIKLLKAKLDTSENLKVPHTPYFFINGEGYAGDPTVEAMTAHLDGLLTKKESE